MIGGATSDIRPPCHLLTLSFRTIAQALCSFRRRSPLNCVGKLWVLVFRFSNGYIWISKI